MDNHLDILAQLAELKKWHEEHCSDQQLNEEDQAKIYQMLGLSTSFITEIHNSNNNNTSSFISESIEDSDPVTHVMIKNDLSDSSPGQAHAVVPKRPFLKRGEGLTNRFKVHPDKFKLQNLPKYKFAPAVPTGKPPKARSQDVPAENPTTTEGSESSAPFKYNVDRTRKSCLKLDSLVHLEDLRTRMTQMCTDAVKDDSAEVPETANVEDPQHEDKVKRMLDFSKKSPRVTFHSEVVRIPFENYFHGELALDLNEEDEVDEDAAYQDEEVEIVVSESTQCDFQVDSAFQRNAFISTPLEVFKERSALPVEKSPRTVLVEKGSELREKIKQLEDETQNFREQNRLIQKTRQALELEKVQLSKERQEMEQTFKEQQLQLEMEFERMKEDFEAERKKLEQKASIPSKKLKDETKNLKHRIEELEADIKSREVKHGTSQTRLRSHIRTLEKENRTHVATIESLKKDVKRLESENARLLRHKNDKMLTEINKNIAKLATTSGESSTGTNAKAKPESGTNKLKKKVPETVPKTVATVPKKIPIERAADSWSESFSDSEPDDNPTRSSDNYFPKLSSSSKTDNEEKENRQVQVPCPLNDTTTGPKREVVHEDGSKDIYYPNGNLKKVSPDGMIVKVMYFNKDIKETNINEGTVKYYYAETKTWHTSFLDGLEILEFPSGQTEHRYKDGKIEIYFPNGTVRITNPKEKDVLEEWRYPDGTVVLETRNKEKIIKLPNGQREIHTADHKRREYPDGTVKIVYLDGKTETRYSNGRIRIKDQNGQLISDSQSVS